MVGPSASSSGKGYFVYTEPKEGEPHQIVGEWGLGEDETGQKWEAIKQVNMPPDPKSVRPDEVEGRFQGGGWDSEGGGTPEAESAPESDGKDIGESYFEGSEDEDEE